MEKTKLVEQLRNFLQQEHACQETVSCLTGKAEIAIRIAQTEELRVRHHNQSIQVDSDLSGRPDFIFDASPAAIEVLIAERGLSPGQLGVKLIKQIVSRDIQFAMPASILQITRKGYLNIIKMGGVEFLSELKKHNLTSLPKIISALKKLRK